MKSAIINAVFGLMLSIVNVLTFGAVSSLSMYDTWDEKFKDKVPSGVDSDHMKWICIIANTLTLGICSSVGMIYGSVNGLVVAYKWHKLLKEIDENLEKMRAEFAKELEEVGI